MYGKSTIFMGILVMGNKVPSLLPVPNFQTLLNGISSPHIMVISQKLLGTKRGGTVGYQAILGIGVSLKPYIQLS